MACAPGMSAPLSEGTRPSLTWMLMSLEVRAAAAVGDCKFSAVMPVPDPGEGRSALFRERRGGLATVGDGVSVEEAEIGLAAAWAFERLAGLRRKGVAGMDLASLDTAFSAYPLPP